ncbi:hypothetical protein [Mycolicibacterium peregrinum]|uniref:hypothetical protein n=1 Tax=Mycolicibacterium peregrinum TaxID=43304 RepID=UPI00146B6783|nr:hypothetical protein [Mycolicibacterium peregrinum]
MTARILRLLTAALILSAALVPATASADPENDSSLANSPTLSFRSLGLDPSISLYGIHGSQTVSFPELPVNGRGGTMVATQNQRTIARVPLPPDGAPVTIPLAGALVVGNAVTVQLDTYLLLPDGYCEFDPANPLRLLGSQIRYTGQELAPRTVADFLPPVLGKLTLFVPSNPSQRESAAAIRIATSVVARYGPQRPVVDIVASDGGAVAPPQPLERQIIVREGDAPGLSLQGPNVVPALVISGPEGELTNQARLLSSDISKLAVESKAVVGPLSVTPSAHRTSPNRMPLTGTRPLPHSWPSIRAGT